MKLNKRQLAWFKQAAKPEQQAFMAKGDVVSINTLPTECTLLRCWW